MRGGKLQYRVFFYGYAQAPGKGLAFHAPQGEATFAPDGRVLECRALLWNPSSSRATLALRA